jgi:hypothetical protein
VIGHRAPFGVYEGAFASRNPVCTLTPGTVVGASDIAVGRFAWADPVTGEVSNTQIAGGQFGIAIPRPGLWAVTYWLRTPNAPPVRMLRAGKPCTIYSSGEFYVRFPLGALIGNPVWVDPATGIAYGSNATGDYVETKWTAVTNARPGSLGIISPYTVIS